MNITTMTTPAGPLTIVVTEAGVVRAAGFTADAETLLALLPVAERGQPRPLPDLGGITKAVTAYLAGELDRLDEVPVAQHSDEDSFLARAWRELRRIPPGEIVSYTELAARTGRPTAIRAAANACARNAIAPFVPCHRVRRADGGLGGYRWGTGVKEWLLAHERAGGGR